MLDQYFSAPKTLARLRAGLSGPYIDCFADPSEKLEAIEAIVPPHLRRGSFRSTDKLIALLKAKPAKF